MVRRMVISFYILSLILLSVNPAYPVKAAAGPEFFAAPSAVMPGGEAAFSGFGFAVNSDVELLFMGPLEFVILGMPHTDSAGNFSGVFQLPVDIAPGTYDVMANPADVLTSITILPALTLNLSPGGGPPGTNVHFTVNNLAAGQLRLDYDGVPVFGPVDVPAGLFEGDFLAPANRPIPLGVDAPVDAVNLLGGKILGLAQSYFTTQEPNPAPYTFQNVILPPDGVEPGYTFPISGEISPALAGPLSNFQLNVLWKAANGKVVPITVGTPHLTPTSFSAQARVPSLLGGDPLIPESGGQVGIALVNLGLGGGQTVQPYPWFDPPDPVFKVKVVDSNGQPIQGAIVDIRAFYSDFGKVEGQTAAGEVLTSSYNNLEIHPNQITAYLGDLSTTQSDPFTCETTNVYGRTDANGEFNVVFDPELIAMMGKKIFIGNLPKPTYMEVPLEIEFPLYVNALHKGFGTVVDGKPQPFPLELRFSGQTNKFYDVKTNQVVATNPFVVTLPKLPTNTKINVPIVPKIQGYSVVKSYKDYLGTGIPMTVFGRFYSFPTVLFPQSLFLNAPTNLRLTFQHDPALYGTLNPASLKLTLDGQVYTFTKAGNPAVEGCNAEEYYTDIPYPYREPAKLYTGMIEIKDQSNPPIVTQYSIGLLVDPAPTWILQPQYKSRSIQFNYFGAIKYQGFQYPPGGPSSSSSLDTNVPKVGMTFNRVNFGDEVVEILYPDKTTGAMYQSQSDNQILSEQAGVKKYEGTMAGGKEIVIPTQTQPVLDTGKFPLYRHVIGIPPIAGVTLGADMWFKATLTTGGKIQFLANGTTSTTLLVYPDATVGVDAFLEGEVLFGLASASAHAEPDIGLGMPATFVNGGLQDSQKCFHYKLVISWKAKIGVCPFCKKWSDKDTLFNDRNPSSCAPPPPAGTAAGEQQSLTLTTPEPPTASPSLAVDGLGHTMLVWSDESNNIQSKLLTGGVSTGQYAITSNMRGIDPQVAFFAPNQAVAVWTESAMPVSYDPLTTTFEQFFQAQHLKYAIWSGSSWGAAQNLTAPADSNGEGSVVLAGCVSTNPSCGVNGAVTAVWVRDLGAAYGERKFRLFYSAFNGSSWSAAAAVDPSSTGTDAEAAIAYSPGGFAQVVWTRDSDRSVSTVTDRSILHRQLPGGQVNVVTEPPLAAVEPSLAVNASGEMVLAFTVAADPTMFIGNQRQLFAAKQDCGGGSCTWVVNPLEDINGRAIHAASPAVTVNSAGQALITYRALGFGPDPVNGQTVFPGDPLGTVIGTGEIGQAFVAISGTGAAIIAPSYQTTGGNTVWQTNAVFDPALNQVFAVASQGAGPTLPSSMLDALSAMGIEVGNLDAAVEPLALTVSNAQPDFSIYDVTASVPNLLSVGQPPAVTVTLHNNGPNFTSGGEQGDLVVKLAWDGPVGTGLPAGEIIVPWVDAGSLQLMEFSSDPAAGTLDLPNDLHLPHSLYVEVNPAQILPESNFINNKFVLDFPGLPAPQGLIGAAQAGDSSVFLQWQPLDTDVVAGYRIYRSSDGRIFEPVGSTFIPGFVDLTGVFGETYLYTVVSYTPDGFESGFADPIQAAIGLPEFPVFLPIIRR